jgi:CNT family concentrative nucleoside transporter
MEFIGIIGLVVLLGLAWLMSNNKSKIRPRVILWGVGLQLLFALIILSQNILSFAGMYIFLCMILAYLFSDKFAETGDRKAQFTVFAGVGVGAAAMIAITFYLDRFGVALYLAILSVAAIVWGFIRKDVVFRRYAIAALFSIVLGIVFARELYGQTIMQVLSNEVTAFLKLTDLGTAFLFDKLAKEEYFSQFGFQFAFRVLPTIIFFAAFMSILYYFGVIQVIVESMAKFMRWTIGTSGAETLSCSANVFVGQTEAPLLIKPFLQDMTISELATIMVGGFATIAGGVLAGYIQMGVDAGHLIAASVMSAPAALVIGKIIFPETEHSTTAGDIKIPEVQTAGNLLEAASNGITDGLKLAVNVAAMLIGFIALIGLFDKYILSILDYLIDGQLLGGALVPVPPNPFSPVTEQYAGIFPGSLKIFFGNVLQYLAFVMGTPWEDSLEVGNLLGLKLAVNEFVAYSVLGQEIAQNAISPRAQIIATYALCGFANFASIGIQIGGIGAIAPERRKDLAKVALKAMFGGAIASWMTATIAGMLL